MKIRYESVPVDDLTPYPGNARMGDVAVIRESLRTHGQFRPLVVQESTGHILAGNHTWLAAREEGYTHVDVGFVDVDDAQARKIVVVDNRANDLAEYDMPALVDLLKEMEDLDGTGFDQNDYDELLASMGPGSFSQKEIEKVIPLPETPQTAVGDVYELGPHRLVCGDALEDAVVYRVLHHGGADMVWTDPPYLVNYQHDLSPEDAIKLNRRTDGKQITNENLTGASADAFAIEVANRIYTSLKPGGVFYMHMPPGPDQVRFIEGVRMHPVLEAKQVIQWVKDRFVFGRSDYHYRQEPILYGWRGDAAHYWCGDRTQDTVWEVKRPRASKEHPTMKPVEVPERCISNSSRSGEVIFDPFAGSGTVLVAAMQQGRRAVMVELDPAYCDVIVERFERLTGQTATKVNQQGEVRK